MSFVRDVIAPGLKASTPKLHSDIMISAEFGFFEVYFSSRRCKRGFLSALRRFANRFLLNFSARDEFCLALLSGLSDNIAERKLPSAVALDFPNGGG